MLDTHSFREGMSCLAASVTIITTDGQAGRHGFTASAVCSVSDAPPTLIVCMNRKVKSNGHFKDNGVLGVNVLAAGQQSLSDSFAGGKRTAEERFAEGQWMTLSTGAPILEEASVGFDCVIQQSMEVGSHTVFVCGVIDIHLGAGAGALVYAGRKYHEVTLKPEAIAEGL